MMMTIQGDTAPVSTIEIKKAIFVPDTEQLTTVPISHAKLAIVITDLAAEYFLNIIEVSNPALDGCGQDGGGFRLVLRQIDGILMEIIPSESDACPHLHNKGHSSMFTVCFKSGQSYNLDSRNNSHLQDALEHLTIQLRHAIAEKIAPEQPDLDS
jgi:hypothetical protein